MAELLPHTQGRPYVLVNVPSYELQVVAQGQVLLYSRVVVGKTATQTPTVRATIRAVDLMPYWHVPPGIAERAIIPAVRKDPTYLARERIRVFSAWGGVEIDPATVNWHAPQASRYVFRQDPGPHNALGLVRIDMPNNFTVYMHDTIETKGLKKEDVEELRQRVHSIVSAPVDAHHQHSKEVIRYGSLGASLPQTGADINNHANQHESERPADHL